MTSLLSRLVATGTALVRRGYAVALGSGPRRLVVLIALAIAAPATARAQCDPIDPSCSSPDATGPVVTLTPAGGTFTSAFLNVSVEWCDDRTLNDGSRSISFNGANVTAQFSYVTVSPTGVCGARATSSGVVTLVAGSSNYLYAEIMDLAGNAGGASASYTYVQNPMIGTTPHNGENRDVGLCLANCFDAALSYSTPSYISMDTPRSVTLVYRKQQAAPTATVAIDVRDTTAAQSPSKLSVRLKNSSGSLVTLLGNRQEVFFSYQAGGWNRVAVQFDAASLATGAYDYTVEVTSHYPNNSTKVAASPVRVLVANEQASLFGAGWSIAGWQRVLSQPAGTAVVTDGVGSVAYFAGSCTVAPCSYTSPAGDFSTLSRIAGADGTAFKRRYPDGAEIYFWSSGRAAYVQDRFGNRSSYGYDASNRLSSITDPTGRAFTLGYEATPSQSIYKAGTLRWIDDGAGRRAEFGVDAASNLVFVKDVDGLTALSASYDTPNRLRSWVDRRGGAWNVDYDCRRNASALTMPTVTVNGQSVRPVVRQASPASQTALCETATNGTASDPLPAVHADNVRGATTDARGFATQYQLDRFGAATRIEEPLGRTTVIGRNQHAQPVYVRSPAGGAVVSTWSGPGLTEIYDSTTTLRTTFRYESVYHQLASRFNGVVRDSNFWSGWKLDSSDVGALGTRRTRYTYETIGGRITGRVATVKDPAGHVVSHGYLTSGTRNLSTVTAAGRTTTYISDVQGRSEVAIAPTGDSTRSSYDVLNRVTSTVGPQRDTTTFAYDALFPTSVRDARGQVYAFAPNALGWVESDTDPAGQSQTFTYDSAGNLKRSTNRRGQAIDFAYDALGQPTSRTADGLTTTFVTDPLGWFTAASNGESVDTVKFDAAGRPVAEITVRGSQRYDRATTYNPHGLRTGLTVDPWGTTRGFRYDGRLALDTLIDAGGGRTVFGKNGEGAVNSIVLPTAAGLAITRDYPGNHAPSQITYNVTAIDTAIRSYYAYGDNGLVERRIKGVTTTEEAGRRYTYDKSHRLTRYVDYLAVKGQYLCEPGTSYLVDPVTGESCWQLASETRSDSAAYAYDIVGNRSDSGAVASAGNRLLRFRGDIMVYDADGNLVKRWALAGGRTDSLAWNSLGQLVSLTRNGVTTTFAYDGLGRRVRKTAGSTTTRYLHDGDELLAELDGAGARVAEYTYYPGIDQPHSVRRWPGGVATTYYFATDHPGNVVGLIDNANTLVNRYGYTPFGSKQDSAGTVPNALRFAARELDEETGLYYNRARYYDPMLGRFISEDPIGIGGGINLYAYTDNSPVNRTDPFGLEWQCTTSKFTAVAENGEVVEGERTVCKDDGKGGGAAVARASLGVVLRTLLIRLNPRFAASLGMTGAGAAGLLSRLMNPQLSSNLHRFLAANPIPQGWTMRLADNKQGWVFQRPGAVGNVDMIRIMNPNAKNVHGYVVYYNSRGHALNVLGNQGNPSNWHISLDHIGQLPYWPGR